MGAEISQLRRCDHIIHWHSNSLFFLTFFNICSLPASHHHYINMTGAVKFLRLNHTNYPEWSMQMEAVLVRADYWELVTGDEALVEGEMDQTKVKAFCKRQAACKAKMILRVDNSQLAHMNSNDSKVIWDSLAKVHHA